MALTHAQPFDSIDLLPLGPRLPLAPGSSPLKSQGLQLMGVVLRASERRPEHHVRGELTLQCLERRAEVPTTPRHMMMLSAGQVVLLPAGEPHAVHTLSDTSLLVTFALHAPTPRVTRTRCA
jgi:quercetin dioxygenase-like cupin family protein